VQLQHATGRPIVSLSRAVHFTASNPSAKWRPCVDDRVCSLCVLGEFSSGTRVMKKTR
jgi:hypothetical protein